MESAGTTGGVTIDRSELATSMMFYRRWLAERIACSAIKAAGGLDKLLSRHGNAARDIEDLANAITERLAARETGDPRGYQSDQSKQSDQSAK